MKTAFHFPVNQNETEPVHLLIELGNQDISLLWFSKQPFAIKGLIVYQVSSEENYTDVVKRIFETPDCRVIHPATVKICFNHKESLLVPDPYFKPAIHDAILSLIYGEKDSMQINTDVIRESALHIVYRIEQSIAMLLNVYFPGALVVHSSSMQIKHVTQEDHLLCIFYHNSIKVILFKTGTLFFVQQFPYNTPDDVVYHLLNSCAQHHVDPSVIALHVCGLVAADSNLYNRLYSYFSNIIFADIPENIPVRDEIKNFLHIFSVT